MSRHNMLTSNEDDDNDGNVTQPARSQLSLDLDVKRVRPIIQQYESGRGKLSTGSAMPASHNIVPSLGLHMLQTGGSPSNNGAAVEARKQGVSRPTQKQLQDSCYAAPKPSAENKITDMKEEIGTLLAPPLEKSEISTKKGETPASSKAAKTLIVLLLLLLQLLLIYSVYINSLSEKSTVSSSIKVQLKNGMAILASCQHALASVASLITKKRLLPFEQLQKRLGLGRSLLSKMNDPLGAYVACSSVTGAVIHHHQKGSITTITDGGGLKSSVLSCLAYLGEDENRLLADALLCMGEAKLALFSPAAVSSLILGNLEARKAELLNAKEALESSISIEPTNSASRAALGLAFLLLGTIHDGSNSDEILQYLIQSIQHLMVAVGWSTETNTVNAMINMAATHNLGLAYLALDNILQNKESQFLDFVSSLQASPEHHPILESTVLNMNRGALLLQKGKTDEAILGLKAIMGISCDDEGLGESDDLSTAVSSHQKDACLLMEQNVAIAKGARDSNEDISSGITVQGHTESELLNDDAQQLSEIVETEGESLLSIELENSTNETLTESTVTSGSLGVDIDTQTSELDSSQLPPKDKVGSSIKHPATWGVRTTGFARKSSPELENALAALEQAAKEGSQRPRLLLALAKARSSVGDVPGAIDATLNAIDAASSVEETDAMTTYLESLMNKLAGGHSDEEFMVRDNQPSGSDSSNAYRDRTVSELEMKLEIEKLKYRVLEQEHALKYQEMRLGGGHNPADFGAIRQAIDYSRGSSHVSPDSISGNYRTIDDVDTQELKQIFVEKIDTENLKAVDLGDAESIESGALEADTSPGKLALAIDEAGADGAEPTEHDSPKAESSEDTAVATEEVGDEDVTRDAAGEEVAVNQTTPALEPMAITLPSLFDPPLNPSTEISATAKSYMKMADAYLDKGMYSLASKQFLKVIRKAPEHLAAHLGYATALERAGKSKQINDAASAYGNATRVAIIQGGKIDPLAKAGTGGMAESILRRAVKIAQSASSGRLELLRTLSTYAHTSALAAFVYHAIGLELTKQNMEDEATRKDAMEAFSIANEFIISRNDTEAPFHVPSIIEMGKIALENERNAIQAIKFFEKVKSLHLEDDDHVKLLVLAGRAHSAVGELDTAISDLTRALSLPQCPSTASAHHELALALSKNNGDQHEINLHFENALDLGMDPTEEALAALGEQNMSIMRSYNRQHWRQYNDGHQGTSGGGIMSGGGVGSQKSVFAPQAGTEEESSAQSDTLTLLEQGAASYDGHVPMGGEIEGGAGSNLSSLSGRKQKAQVT